MHSSLVFLTTFFPDFLDFFFFLLFFFFVFFAFGSWTISPSLVTWLNLQSSPNLHSPVSAKFQQLPSLSFLNCSFSSESQSSFVFFIVFLTTCFSDFFDF